ncbi:hypothetical protein [Roseburia inulinivorans]
MIIENGDSKFTEEEKRNLVVREYTSEEIQQNKKAYVNKSTKKCFPLIVLIVLCSICSYILPDMSYAIDIVMVIIIFLFILTIIINILNYRIAKRWHYIELVVDKKLPIEAESRDAGASDDSCMIYHYPVEGRDSTSGYASIFYVGKEKYENAEVGEKIWINVEYAD